MRKKLTLPRFLEIIASILVLLILIGLLKVIEEPKPGEPYISLPALRSDLKSNPLDLTKPVIDLSGYQRPKTIDYVKLSKNIIGAVVRVQFGTRAAPGVAVKSDGTDSAFSLHMTELQKEGIPVAVYAYANGKSISEMKEEAKAFYNRAKAYQPTFWWIDVENSSMPNMNTGVEAFRSELKSLGARKVGLYSRDGYLTEQSITSDKFDALWLAYYGLSDDGSYTALKTQRQFQMQQFTDKGQVAGYSGNVDLSRVNSQKDYEKLFLGK